MALILHAHVRSRRPLHRAALCRAALVGGVALALACGSGCGSGTSRVRLAEPIDHGETTARHEHLGDIVVALATAKEHVATGLIIDDGLVLTAAHAVAELGLAGAGSRATIVVDGEKRHARVAARQDGVLRDDWALLAIDGVRRIRAVDFAPSPTRSFIEQVDVLMVGYPSAYATASAGRRGLTVISARARRDVGDRLRITLDREDTLLGGISGGPIVLRISSDPSTAPVVVGIVTGGDWRVVGGTVTVRNVTGRAFERAPDAN